MSVDIPAPVPPSRMRRAVIRSVTASAAVPQFSVELDLCADPLLWTRRAARARMPRLSVTDLVHHAVARALTEHPLLNASYSDDGVVTHQQVNVAFIVEVADGMVTPSIADAPSLSLRQLADERARLTAGALVGGLSPDEMLSGTFTVSNLGPLGVHRFTAMVLPPQSAVLAVGAPGPSRTLTLTLTCDHRVVDGAPAARFLSAVGDLLSPTALAATIEREFDAVTIACTS